MAKTVFRQQTAARAVGLEPSWAVQAGTPKVCRTELVRDGYRWSRLEYSASSFRA